MQPPVEEGLNSFVLLEEKSILDSLFEGAVEARKAMSA